MSRIMGLQTCRLVAAPMLAAVLVYSVPAQATTISQTLGGIDFANGQTVAAGTFNAASTGQPAPFNAFIGSDVVGPNFSASWSFSYGTTDTISGATLEIGLLDGDSAASGPQVASYSIGGIDLTSLLNTAMEATPGANSVEIYYTIPLPSSTFSILASGSPTVSLTLQGPGLGVLGTTTFNGAALDFSTITIDTVAAIPLPGTLPLFASGLGALGLLHCRRKRKATGFGNGDGVRFLLGARQARLTTGI